MEGNYFTKEELMDLKLDDLKRIADYLQVEYSAKNIKKAQLVELILKSWEPSMSVIVSDSNNVPKMSVRLQRIYERNGGKLP